MELRLLKELFRSGVLGAVSVTPAPMEENSWIIMIDRLNGPSEIVTTQRGQQKQYKSLPGAMEDVRRIGFREARVMLPSDSVPIKR